MGPSKNSRHTGRCGDFVVVFHRLLIDGDPAAAVVQGGVGGLVFGVAAVVVRRRLR